MASPSSQHPLCDCILKGLFEFLCSYINGHLHSTSIFVYIKVAPNCDEVGIGQKLLILMSHLNDLNLRPNNCTRNNHVLLDCTNSPIIARVTVRILHECAILVRLQQSAEMCSRSLTSATCCSWRTFRRRIVALAPGPGSRHLFGASRFRKRKVNVINIFHDWIGKLYPNTHIRALLHFFVIKKMQLTIIIILLLLPKSPCYILQWLMHNTGFRFNGKPIISNAIKKW